MNTTRMHAYQGEKGNKKFAQQELSGKAGQQRKKLCVCVCSEILYSRIARTTFA